MIKDLPQPLISHVQLPFLGKLVSEHSRIATFLPSGRRAAAIPINSSLGFMLSCAGLQRVQVHILSIPCPAVSAVRLPRPASRRRTLVVEARHIVGIDLGTSNSSVAIIRGGSAEIVLSRDGSTIPSCVAVLEVTPHDG